MKTVKDTYKLSNGVEIPCLGFGTWQISDAEIAYTSTLEALKAGYRHIDTAAAYGNEKAVGKAIKDSGIPREEIFLTTKLRNPHHSYDLAIQALNDSLKKLGTDYVDLYLIHWPNPKAFRDTFYESNKETWRALEDLYKEGKAKAIGISNFMPHHIDATLEIATIKPMVNQIRLYPGFELSKTVEVCKKHGILLEAYSPLGTGKIFEAQELKEIAEKYNKSVAQLCIRYSLQKGYIPLPKSQTPSRIKENIDVYDFKISEEDMKKIESIPNYCGEGANPDKTDW